MLYRAPVVTVSTPAAVARRLGFPLTLRDGKMTRFEIYGERGRAREAAGLTHGEADTGTT
jgi:hypothetical protein